VKKPSIVKLDLKGMPCPGPVVETRNALLRLEKDVQDVHLTVVVDNQAASLNVTRFAESLNCTVSRTEVADGTFILDIFRSSGSDCELPEAASEPAAAGSSDRYILYIDSSRMGRGDERLGRILLKAFLKTLSELESLPQTIIFVNEGVHLTTVDSPEIATIKALEDGGCAVLVCGTCLDFYHLKDKLGVGQVSNMFEIAAFLTGPDQVVRP
jgi:tRNA 2-thiouridine synthesizing protein A